MNIREKLYDFKNRLKDRHMYSIIIVLLAICIALGIGLYKKQTELVTFKIKTTPV